MLSIYFFQPIYNSNSITQLLSFYSLNGFLELLINSGEFVDTYLVKHKFYLRKCLRIRDRNMVSN